MSLIFDLAFQIAIFLILITNKIHGNSQQWYDQLRRRYVNYGIFNRDFWPYSSSDYEGSVPLQSNWRSFFNQQNTRQIIQYPMDDFQSSSPGNSMQSERKFSFPDHSVSREMGGHLAPSCEGASFCENVSGYPLNFLDTEIKKNRNFQNYENVDVVDMITPKIDVSDTESLCVSTERVVYPKSAETISKQWLFVVNHPNYTQGIRIETCMEEGSGCKIIDSFAEGYATSCEQKYIYRQLTAITADGSFGREYFRFPSSCCCHVRFTGFMPRIRTSDPPVSKII